MNWFATEAKTTGDHQVSIVSEMRRNNGVAGGRGVRPHLCVSALGAVILESAARGRIPSGLGSSSIGDHRNCGGTKS